MVLTSAVGHEIWIESQSDILPSVEKKKRWPIHQRTDGCSRQSDRENEAQRLFVLCLTRAKKITPPERLELSTS
jgi:hypothetical protein